MTRRGLLKRNLAFLITAVMAIGVVSYVPNDVTKVQAEDTMAKTNVELGTSGISNPTLSDSRWSGSYVYFGKYNGNAVKYRVLDNETTVFSKADSNGNKAKTMLLDCDSVLWTGDGSNGSSDSRFDKDGKANEGASKANEWAYSDIKRFLNSEKDSTSNNNVPAYDYSSTGFLTTSFSKTEQNAIAASTKENIYAGDSGNSNNGKDGDGVSYLDWEPLTGEKIFLLDAKEATNESYGYSNSSSRKKTGGNADWRLRSPDTYNASEAGYVLSVGIISSGGVDGGIVGVSPALNINLSSVLFSSEILNSEEKLEGYKLTLIDDKLEITITSDENVTRNDNEVTIPYTISGNDVGNVTQVSVLITDKAYETGNENGANVLYYGALTLSEGKVTFTLPADSTTLDLSDKVCGKDYFAYIVAEDVNGTYETDYASTPCEISIPSKPWVAPTVNTINIGTSAISSPFEPVSSGDVNTAWTGCYVYFGTYDGNSVKYRVLDSETTVFSEDSTTKTMLLDCDSVLEQRVFGTNGNKYWEFDSYGSDGSSIVWKNSDIKEYLNDTFLKNSFSTIERNAITASVKSEPDVNDGSGQWELSYFPLLHDNYIFLLDAKEATNTSYGYSNTSGRTANRVKGDKWWLRSYETGMPQADGLVFENGYIEYISPDDTAGVSPALNIKLSDVLFSSKAGMSKSSVLGTDSIQIGTEQVTEWKLTLKDSGKSVSITDGKTVTKKSDGTITVPYTYSDISANDAEKVNQISVMITDNVYTDSTAKILYYGKLDTGTSLSTSGSTGTFKLPDALKDQTLESDYHLYILAEHTSDTNATDYASEPAEITAITDEPAAADTGNSDNSSSNTNTDNTTVVSSDESGNNVANNTVSVKKSNNKKTAKTVTPTEPVKEEVKEETSGNDEQVITEETEETIKDTQDTTENQTTEEPTGDTSADDTELAEDSSPIWPWIVLAILVFGGFIFFIIYKKRKEDEEEQSD